jgi:hypothetical protein
VIILAKKASVNFNEKTLTKGQLRKLGALRKSLGKEIADRAFAEWIEKIGREKTPAVDENVEAIVEALSPLFKSKKIKIPRGGFLVTRWRNQIIVKSAPAKK